MAIVSAQNIIQDRLIFAASNIAPALELRDKYVFAVSAARSLVRKWQRAHAKEKETASIDAAEAKRKAGAQKKQRTDGNPTAPETKEVRCVVLKDYAGQSDQPDALVVEKDEIVFRTAEPGGDGWVNVRRERDDAKGVVPQKRVREAPLPPSPHADARAAPVLSSEDEEDDEAPKAPKLTLEQVDKAIESFYETHDETEPFLAADMYVIMSKDDRAIDLAKMSALKSTLSKLCEFGVDGESAATYEYDSHHDEYNVIS
eukprot:1159462-Prymnesium_polylepis.1